MAFHLKVIASIDENSISNAVKLSNDRNSAPPSRPTIYLSREQSIQLKLRNTVVALTFPGTTPDHPPSPPIYASVKIYSKESALFRNCPHFPDKLVATESSGPKQKKTWPAIVSNLLWWEIEKQQLNVTREYREEIGMDIGHAPISMTAEVVTKLGNATSISIISSTTNNSNSQLRINGAAIAQSLSGYIASLNGWINFKSSYGSQMFKIVQINTVGGDRTDVSTVSDSTVVKFVSPGNRPFISPDNDMAHMEDLITKEDWKSSVKQAIGGYDDIISQIIDQMRGFIGDTYYGSTSQLSSNKARSCYQAPFKGILITGRPGTGKSVLASSLAKSSRLPYSIVNCPDVFQTDAGASENYLRDAFSSLLSQGKSSILILDEVDMIASDRASRKGVEAKLYATLLNLIDSINLNPHGNKVFVIALTNRIHAVDNSLVRSGRLDKIFDLHLKGFQQRFEVLEIVSKDLPMDPEQRQDILSRVAKATHGFVPTDLQALCTECALMLISRMSLGDSANVNIDYSFFAQALKTIRPSGMGEFLSKIPAVTFNDLFGIQDAIDELKVSIIEPFHRPEKYIAMGIPPPRGLLVHGPPGVGKTMLCCALAEELGINFMLVESSQIRSKVVGESEQNIARMFAQAKANAPCILFIDQIDVLAPSRGSTNTSENSGDRIVTGLLTEMDGFFTGNSKNAVQVDVLVLAATNRPEVIDSAILRPGRLDQILHIPAPDEKTRQSILEGYMSKMPMEINPDGLRNLAVSTVGYSGADLENLCREAALICLRENIHNTKILMSHLESAKIVSKPSLIGYKDGNIFER